MHQTSLYKRNWILERLEQFGQSAALIHECRSISYRELSDKTREILLHCAERDYQRQVVVLIGDYDINTIAWLFALFIQECIVVPLSSSAREQRDRICELVQADSVVDLGHDENSFSKAVNASKKHQHIALLQSAGEPGLILISSGSTGQPKAMLLHLDRLIEKHRTNQTFRAFRTAAFLLFDHVGGFNTLVHTLMNGGALVVLTSREPRYVCNQIERQRIELLPATPTFLNMVLIGEFHRLNSLASLKVITYGTEVMPNATLEKAVERFPQVKFKQTYGMSELGILPTKSKEQKSLWIKIGDGVETQIDVRDNILWIKTKTAMLGYLNAPSPFDADGWLCTGDVVEVSGEYIKIVGRLNNIINVAGLKVFPAEIENHLLQLSYIEDVVVWGKMSHITGEIVAATIRLRENVDDTNLKKDITRHCRHLDDYKVPRYVEFVKEALYSERYKKARKSRAQIRYFEEETGCPS